MTNLRRSCATHGNGKKAADGGFNDAEPLFNRIKNSKEGRQKRYFWSGCGPFMSLGQSIRSGVKWLFIGNTGSQALTFIFGIVLARLLVPGDFGMLVTISVFTGLAGFIAGGGMGQALVRAKEVSKRDYDIVFTLQIVIGGLIYASFFFAAPWFAEWYKTPLYTDLLRVSSLSFIFRPFVNLPGSILFRNMRFKEQSIVGIVSLIISSAVSIGMAYMGYGVWSLIFGGVAGAVANMGMLIPLAKWRPGLSLEFRRGRDIARYGLMVSATDILVYLRLQVGVFVLSRTLGPASVGLYNKGESLAKMPHSFITHSVYHVLFRAMAAEQDNLDKCRYLFFRSISLVAVYATPFYVGLFWLAEPFINGVYGPKWTAAAAPLLILTLAWPFWLMENLSGAVLAAMNWLGRELFVQISTLIIFFLAVLIGVPHGIKGVAYGIVGATVYTALHMLWLALGCLKASWLDYVRALIPAALLNTILAGVLFLVDRVLPPGLRASDFIYIALMAMTGGLAYALCFLYLPITSLQGEQQRWKTKLRLYNAMVS
jgi:O-antigen/teichoic acid export membrane protein